MANPVIQRFRGNNIFDVTPRKRGVTSGLTAHAGGTQAAALALTGDMAEVTTVGTAADSVRLPLAIAGATFDLVNAAASNSMTVYGAGTDTINNVATATGVAQAAGKSAHYFCVVTGNWYRVLSA